MIVELALMCEIILGSLGASISSSKTSSKGSAPLVSVMMAVSSCVEEREKRLFLMVNQKRAQGAL